VRRDEPVRRFLIGEQIKRADQLALAAAPISGPQISTFPAQPSIRPGEATRALRHVRPQGSTR
jgi:hypothetical protein